MIQFSNEHLLQLAQGCLRSGDLEQARSVLRKLPSNQRPCGLLESVTYDLAKQRLAQGHWESSKELFAESSAHDPHGVLRSLSQERSRLINAISRRETVFAASLKPLFEEAHVQSACSIAPDLLMPDISFVGCPAAYRSGYDPRRADALSQLIRLIKKGVDDSAIHRLGAYLAAYVFYATHLVASCDFIVPVPTNPERETLRGYSIPRILAEELSKACAIPLHEEFVRATGKGLELRQVPRWYRKQAVSGAFAVGSNADWLVGRSALIVDDVITTGATVSEVAKLLSYHGARDVSAIALAHTERSK